MGHDGPNLKNYLLILTNFLIFFWDLDHRATIQINIFTYFTNLLENFFMWIGWGEYDNLHTFCTIKTSKFFYKFFNYLANYRANISKCHLEWKPKSKSKNPKSKPIGCIFRPIISDLSLMNGIDKYFIMVWELFDV